LLRDRPQAHPRRAAQADRPQDPVHECRIPVEWAGESPAAESCAVSSHRRVPFMSQAHARRSRRVRLGRSSNGMLMSPEEFDRREDFDRRYAYELIHGVLIVSPPPGESERDPNEELAYLLRSYQKNHPEGRVLDKTLSEQYVHLANSRRRA